VDTFNVTNVDNGQLMNERQRWMQLDGAANVRDLGGYSTGRGGVVRLGQLYRGDSPHRLSAADLDQLSRVGIRTRIDLRRHDEVERFGSGPLSGLAGVTMHAPLRATLVREGNAQRSLEELYRAYLLESGYELASCVRLLADPCHRPALFHCYAGKDRTGVLAALLLSVLGVPNELIVADYVATARAREHFWALAEDELRQSVAPGESFSADSPALSANPQTMEGLLAWIEVEYGSAEAYLVGVGVAPSIVDRLRDELVDG
jgi:protein-tyrosine phosphatase